MQSFDDYLSNFNTNNNQTSDHSNTINADYEAKKQELTFIIQQILTCLLACGVLEFANGFENAINKLFKVILVTYTAPININYSYNYFFNSQKVIMFGVNYLQSPQMTHKQTHNLAV